MTLAYAAQSCSYNPDKPLEAPILPAAAVGANTHVHGATRPWPKTLQTLTGGCYPAVLYSCSHNARQCLLTRGLIPMLATPQPHGDAVLSEAIMAAARMGIVKPHNHVVAVQRIHDDFCVKIVSVDSMGAGIKRTVNLGECLLCLASLLC